MLRTRHIFGFGALVLVVAPACSDDDSPSARSATASEQVTDRVRAFVLAFDRHDGDALIDGLSADACQNEFGESCETLRSHVADIFVDQPAIDIRDLDQPVIDGDHAAIEVTARIQSALHHTHFALVRTGQDWLIDDFQIDAEPPIAPPDGVPAVDVTLDDYAFDLDTSELASGSFVLKIHNAGAQQHELAIKRVDVEADLATALDPNAVQPAANTYFIPVASTAPIAPDADATLVLAETLPPGHYFIFCELSDPGGTNHLAKGMATEFTVRR